MVAYVEVRLCKGSAADGFDGAIDVLNPVLSTDEITRIIDSAQNFINSTEISSAQDPYTHASQVVEGSLKGLHGLMHEASERRGHVTGIIAAAALSMRSVKATPTRQRLGTAI